MDAMTVKNFLTLGKRDYENGAVRDAIYIALKEREELKRELPEITDAWTGKKAKEIKALIEQAQDEDLEDPATSLHYLGLSLDIVTSILDELALKIQGK